MRGERVQDHLDGMLRAVVEVGAYLLLVGGLLVLVTLLVGLLALVAHGSMTVGR
jgi:hypothetical protein